MLNEGNPGMRKLSLFLFLAATLGADQVVMKNGDRLSGSIVKTDDKALYLKSAYAGEVKIDRTAVEKIVSEAPLNLVLKDGQKLVGAVDTVNGKVEVKSPGTGIVTTDLVAIDSIRNKEAQQAYDEEIDRLRNPRLLDLWTGSFDVGLATAQGNSDSTTFNMGFDAARITPRDKIGVYFLSLYASTTPPGAPKLTTANAMRGGLKYDMAVSRKVFGFGFTEQEYDKFKHLDLRFVGGGGLGYHVWKSDRGFWDTGVGGAFTKEFYWNDVKRSSGELVFREESMVRLFKNTVWEQRFVVYPNMSEGGEYRVNFDTALAVGLSRWLAWRLAYSDRFQTNPLPGTKRNDVVFTTGLKFTFARAK